MCKLKKQVVPKRDENIQIVADILILNIMIATLLPWLLIRCFGRVFSIFGIMFACYRIIRDSGARIHFFTLQCRWRSLGATGLCLLLSTVSLALELTCLFSVAFSGLFPRQNYLAASLLTSALVRTLEKYGGRNRNRKEERVSPYTSGYHMSCLGFSIDSISQMPGPSAASTTKESQHQCWGPLTNAPLLSQATRRRNEKRQRPLKRLEDPSVSNSGTHHKNIPDSLYPPPSGSNFHKVQTNPPPDFPPIFRSVSEPTRISAPESISESLYGTSRPGFAPVFQPTLESVFQEIKNPASGSDIESVSESIFEPVSESVGQTIVEPIFEADQEVPSRTNVESTPEPVSIPVSKSIPDSFFDLPPRYRNLPPGFPLEFLESPPVDPLANGAAVFECQFPNSASIIPTIGDGLCGLHAIRNSLLVQAPHLPRPEVTDLLAVLDMQDADSLRVRETLEHSKYTETGRAEDAWRDNRSWFLQDHLGFIFVKYFKTRGLDVALGIRTRLGGRTFYQVHRDSKNPEVIWIDNSGGAHYSGLERI